MRGEGVRGEGGGGLYTQYVINSALHFYNNETMRLRQIKGEQHNCTQDNSFFKGNQLAVLGGIITHDTLLSRQALYNSSLIQIPIIKVVITLKLQA